MKQAKTKKPNAAGSEKKKKSGQKKVHNKKEKKLRVLILEENPVDAELMERQLKKDGIDFTAQRVDTRSKYLKALKAFQPDLILADFKLPKFNALQALDLNKKMAPQLPFIVVTGAVSEEVAVECMKLGADDYLLKDRLARLGEAIQHTLKIRQLQAEKAVFEAALQASAESWRTTFDSMNDAVCLLDRQGAIQRCNRAMKCLLDFPFNQIIGRDCLELIYGKEKRKSCAFTQMKKTRQRMEEESFWRGHWYHIRVDPVIGPAGKLIGAVHIMTDITQQKESAQKLRSSEERYRQVFDRAGIGIGFYSRGGRSLLFNEQAARNMGGIPADFEGKDLQELYPGALGKLILKRIRKACKTSANVEYEDFLHLPGGDKWFLSDYTVIRDDTESILGVQIISRDMSERKKIEDALKNSEIRYRNHFENSSEFYFSLDLKGNFINVNKAAVILTGYTKSELLKMNFKDYTPKSDHNKLFRTLSQVYKTGKPLQNFLVEAVIKDKSTKYFETNFSLMKENERIIGFQGSSKDITKRKQTETALIESEDRYRDLVENSQELIFTHDLKGRLLSINKIATQLTGYSIEELLGMNITALLVPEVRHLFNAYLTQIRTTGRAKGRMRILTAGGENRYWEYDNTLRTTGVTVPTVRGLAHDITEREQAEKQVQASLQEKEILLKEIHHRVKNNLQIISGLLTLQASQIGDERLQVVLRESQSRIWTMALIHETLYQTGNLDDIDMADYIRSLSGNLLSSHAQVAMPPTIVFHLLPLRLVIDKAIPLALIINELVTNAMKHAFPDGQPGEICISLQERRGTACRARNEETNGKYEKGTARRAPTENTGTDPHTGTARCAPTDHGRAPAFELTVADNGVGLPAGFDLKNQKSLGLQLVTMLARQLGGTLTSESKGGTSVAITFSSNEKN